MKPLDEELRSALRRLEPPPDFAKRVLARIEAGRHPKAGWGRARLTSWMASFRLPRVARLRWIAAGALASDDEPDRLDVRAGLAERPKEWGANDVAEPAEKIEIAAP